ncbi:MAG: alpha/beta hydrolase [Woeseiaceae bacterium]|nr:alpha/beta hydrolase [Woeseiaceae bacterium]
MTTRSAGHMRHCSGRSTGHAMIAGLLFLLATTVPMADERNDLLTGADLANFPNPPADARIAYGDDPLQFGDLRLPPGDGPHPVAVFLHGGCWLSEYDIAHSSKLTAALAANGIATWSLEYRRVGDDGGGWPGTFEDVARGMNHLAAVAPAYDLDPARVIAMGHSAGGQLALWLAARAGNAADSVLAAAHDVPLRGVLALAPAADFDYLYEHGTCDDAVARLMGGSPADVPERYRLADPMRFAPGDVPQVIVVGRHDDIWTPPARNYYRLARSRGDDVRLAEAPDAGHFELIDPDSGTWPLVLEAARSLLGEQGDSPLN